MSFGLKFVSIASIAGVFAWAASAAPLQPLGSDQSQDFGYGYGAAKVTICHIPPGNPGNAHTITVGAPAVPAHLAHGDTLGPCPEVLAAAGATQSAGTQETKHGKGKSRKNEEPTTESTTTSTTTTTTTEQSGASGQNKSKKGNQGHSNGVGHGPAPTTTTQASSPGNGNGNGQGGGNGNGSGNGNGKANGHNK